MFFCWVPCSAILTFVSKVWASVELKIPIFIFTGEIQEGNCATLAFNEDMIAKGIEPVWLWNHWSYDANGHGSQHFSYIAQAHVSLFLDCLSNVEAYIESSAHGSSIYLMMLNFNFWENFEYLFSNESSSVFIFKGRMVRFLAGRRELARVPRVPKEGRLQQAPWDTWGETWGKCILDEQ